MEIWRGLLPGLHSNPKALETQRQEQIIVWTCFISTCFLLIVRGAKLSSDAKKRPHSIVSYCYLRLVLYYVQLIFHFSPFSIVVHFDLSGSMGLGLRQQWSGLRWEGSSGNHWAGLGRGVIWSKSDLRLGVSVGCVWKHLFVAGLCRCSAWRCNCLTDDRYMLRTWW